MLTETQDQPSDQYTEDAIIQLYQTMRPSLRWYVHRLVGSTSDAEDLVQLAFLKVFDELRRNTQIQNLRSWLYRVTHNLAIDELRRHCKHKLAIEDWISNTDATARSVSMEDELIQRQIIARALELLNERERHCLMLRAEGLSYKEISQALTISAKAVSVYLTRGLKKFEARCAQRR